MPDRREDNEEAEPVGCEPVTHWEHRTLQAELALQEVIMLIGDEFPELKRRLGAIGRRWTEARDKLRDEHRFDE